MKTIGIFGSCDKDSLSSRKTITDTLKNNNIEYFDCYTENWDPNINGKIEAEHLSKDDIILYPITKSSFAFIGLAEIGFVVTNIILRNAKLILMIEDLDNLIDNNDIRKKLSIEVRTLVKKHLEKLDDKTKESIFLVDDIDEMIYKTLELYNE